MFIASLRKRKMIKTLGKEKGLRAKHSAQRPRFVPSRGAAACGAARPAGPPRMRTAQMQKRARASKKIKRHPSALFHQTRICTKHPGVLCLRNGQVPDLPARDGAALVGKPRLCQQQGPTPAKPAGRPPPTIPMVTTESGGTRWSALGLAAAASGGLRWWRGHSDDLERQRAQ
jgi:hypothetical protein